MSLAATMLSCVVVAGALGPGEHYRSIEVDGLSRSYLVHVPPKYDPTTPIPVVLAFHGAATNALIMAVSTHLNAKADAAPFVAVYPNGTGKASILLVWNSGGFNPRGEAKMPNDVAFVDHLLDDLAGVVNIDPRRVYATGMSNGGMMCYRLAAELSHRIAAIAPVSGTMNPGIGRPPRAVPVIHFHGTKDRLVPFEGPSDTTAKVLDFESVEDTIRTWAAIDGCRPKPRVVDFPNTARDGTTVQRRSFGPGRDGAEVVLYVIREGGHTWPGRPWPVAFLGKTTHEISATDLIWDFFQAHPMPATPPSRN